MNLPKVRCSIFEEIKKTEDTIKECYDRVKQLENKLLVADFSEEQKNTLENELKEVKKLLQTNEEQLSKLHGQNGRSFIVAASLFFLCFLVYGLYAMFGEKSVLEY